MAVGLFTGVQEQGPFREQNKPEPAAEGWPDWQIAGKLTFIFAEPHDTIHFLLHSVAVSTQDPEEKFGRELT